MKRKLTQEQINDIVYMSKEGKTQNEIAGLVGVTQGSVSRVIKKYCRQQEQTQPEQTPDAWSKPLNQCHPREIFDYLRSLGYSGDLIYTKKVTI